VATTRCQKVATPKRIRLDAAPGVRLRGCRKSAGNSVVFSGHPQGFVDYVEEDSLTPMSFVSRLEMNLDDVELHNPDAKRSFLRDVQFTGALQTCKMSHTRVWVPPDLRQKLGRLSK